MNIISLWRYPVKSLLGEELGNVEVEPRGFRGDRAYAVTDTQGKFGSGKNTRRFTRIDNLFTLSAKLENDGVAVQFPNGDVFNSAGSDLNRQLSVYLGQEVILQREDKTPHFDDGSIHIITSGALNNLQKLVPQLQIDARRFRPNIVIETELSDDDLLGKIIDIDGLSLQVTHKTQRCRMVTLAQYELQDEELVLKAITENSDRDFGIYAKVITPATISTESQIAIRA